MSIPKIPPNLLRDAANIGRIFGITIKKQRNFKRIGKIARKSVRISRINRGYIRIKWDKFARYFSNKTFSINTHIQELDEYNI